jgi:hypothetical protein
VDEEPQQQHPPPQQQEEGEHEAQLVFTQESSQYDGCAPLEHAMPAAAPHDPAADTSSQELFAPTTLPFGSSSQQSAAAEHSMQVRSGNGARGGWVGY